jgi:transposase InsO family protein
MDDHSRCVYGEIPPDETKESASAFITGALEHFCWDRGHGEASSDDSGSCYRSRDFDKVLADHDVKHKRTRPYRPQTSGKVERLFNRVLQ